MKSSHHHSPLLGVSALEKNEDKDCNMYHDVTSCSWCCFNSPVRQTMFQGSMHDLITWLVVCGAILVDSLQICIVSQLFLVRAPDELKSLDVSASCRSIPSSPSCTADSLHSRTNAYESHPNNKNSLILPSERLTGKYRDRISATRNPFDKSLRKCVNEWL